MSIALRTLFNRCVWYWKAFYDPQFGWFRFGAGYWLKYIVTFRFYAS